MLNIINDKVTASNIRVTWVPCRRRIIWPRSAWWEIVRWLLAAGSSSFMLFVVPIDAHIIEFFDARFRTRAMTRLVPVIKARVDETIDTYRLTNTKKGNNSKYRYCCLLQLNMSLSQIYQSLIRVFVSHSVERSLKQRNFLPLPIGRIEAVSKSMINESFTNPQYFWPFLDSNTPDIFMNDRLATNKTILVVQQM